MPKITFPLADLRALAGDEALDLERLDRLVELVKGELKASDEAEVKVELQDTNRPDTWCVEGIARHLRRHRGVAARDYGFFTAGEPAGAVEVDPSVEAHRPYVAAFLARGYAVDDAGLEAFISAQEVLCRNFGRMRKSVAIGIYDASAMELPVRYEAVPLDSSERAFVPLPPTGEEEVRDGAGAPIPAARWDEAWTPAAILADHPTGREYAGALAGDRAPILVDAAGEVLSFPPIINSRTLGRVTPGMDHLFVEVTGTVLDQVLLAANILAANLADRGAAIEPVVTRYPFETPRGREVRCPHPLEDRRSVEVPLADLCRLLGEPGLESDEVARALEAFDVAVDVRQTALTATTPPWRADYLHPVDAIEDFAISRGYDRFEPLMPEEFTVGHLAPLTVFGDWARDVMIGCGFEEAIGNILTAEAEVRDKMRLADRAGFEPLHGGELVRIQNVMNRNYAVLRDWAIPTLLEVERRSSGALYPHRVFEVGEVGVWAPDENLATRTELRLAALLCHEKAGFSDLHATLDEVLRRRGLAFAQEAGPGAYVLEPCDHAAFIPGRAARIRAGGQTLGVTGELHPEVLVTWGLHQPAAAFELRLDALAALA